MKTYYLAAALLMASTAAHAGSGISFQVNGQRVHIDAPRNCESLSCVQITAPRMSGNLKGLTSKLNKDKDDDDAPSPAPSTQANSAPPAQKTVPAPTASTTAPRAQAPAPLPAAVVSNAQPAATDTSNTSVPLLHDVTPSASTSAPPPVSTTAAAAPAPAVAVSPTAQPAAVADTRLRRSACGRRRTTKAMCRSSRADESLRLCGENPRADPDQHEAGQRQQMDRPDSRSRRRQQLRLDHRDEGTEPLEGPGLRVRRPVLRRPDLEADQLNPGSI